MNQQTNRPMQQQMNRPKPRKVYAPVFFVLAVWVYTLAYIFELYMRYSQ